MRSCRRLLPGSTLLLLAMPTAAEQTCDGIASSGPLSGWACSKYVAGPPKSDLTCDQLVPAYFPSCCHCGNFTDLPGQGEGGDSYSYSYDSYDSYDDDAGDSAAPKTLPPLVTTPVTAPRTYPPLAPAPATAAASASSPPSLLSSPPPATPPATPPAPR